MMKRLLASLFLLGFFSSSVAQVWSQEPNEATEVLLADADEMEAGDDEGDEEEEDEIETDRDSFTPATTLAGAGRSIFEAAHSFIDNRSVPETHSYPELLVRVGATEWLEMRLGWNYEVGGAGSPVSGNVPSDFGDDAELERASRILYGAKFALTEQAGSAPQTALILQGYTPTSGESNETDFSVTYVAGWTLPNDWVWDSAIHYGTARLEEDDFNIWAPSTVLKIPVGERWKIHAEYFGIYSDGRADETVQQFFSPGAHYLITSNLEIGVRVGWGLNQEAPNFFSNVGLGWRY
jgi:hypothetical protein